MRSTMKTLRYLVWLTQLGLSVAVPLVLLILLAVWLRGRFSLGAWIVWIGVVCGILGAVGGLRSSLKALHRMAEEDKEPPPCGFNDHD